MKKLLVFGEKPSLNRACAPLLPEAFPGHSIIYLSALPFVNPALVYPRGLGWSDYPLVDAPRYKIAGIEEFLPATYAEGGMRRIAHPDAHAILHEWDQLFYACDPDHSGAICFYTIAEMLYGKEIWNNPNVSALQLVSLDSPSVRKAVENRSPFLPTFAGCVSYGLVKRYIDWNWNANALAILGQSLRQAGTLGSNPVISKYALQLLYFIRSNPGLSEGKLHERMSKWVGSGKYPASHNFGSCASRPAMVEQLDKLGLITRLRAPFGNGNVHVECYMSALGERFLDLLHKDCCDPDLPMRIEQWCLAGMDVAQPKVDRYIRTFFGKQKGFCHEHP